MQTTTVFVLLVALFSVVASAPTGSVSKETVHHKDSTKTHTVADLERELQGQVTKPKLQPISDKDDAEPDVTPNHGTPDENSDVSPEGDDNDSAQGGYQNDPTDVTQQKQSEEGPDLSSSLEGTDSEVKVVLRDFFRKLKAHPEIVEELMERESDKLLSNVIGEELNNEVSLEPDDEQLMAFQRPSPQLQQSPKRVEKKAYGYSQQAPFKLQPSEQKSQEDTSLKDEVSNSIDELADHGPIYNHENQNQQGSSVELNNAIPVINQQESILKSPADLAKDLEKQALSLSSLPEGGENIDDVQKAQDEYSQKNPFINSLPIFKDFPLGENADPDKDKNTESSRENTKSAESGIKSETDDGVREQEHSHDSKESDSAAWELPDTEVIAAKDANSAELEGIRPGDGDDTDNDNSEETSEDQSSKEEKLNVDEEKGAETEKQKVENAANIEGQSSEDQQQGSETSETKNKGTQKIDTEEGYNEQPYYYYYYDNGKVDDGDKALLDFPDDGEIKNENDLVRISNSKSGIGHAEDKENAEEDGDSVSNNSEEGNLSALEAHQDTKKKEKLKETEEMEEEDGTDEEDDEETGEDDEDEDDSDADDDEEEEENQEDKNNKNNDHDDMKNKIIETIAVPAESKGEKTRTFQEVKTLQDAVEDELMKLAGKINKHRNKQEQNLAGQPM